MRATQFIGRPVYQASSRLYLGDCADLLVDVKAGSIPFVLLDTKDGTEAALRLLVSSRLSVRDDDLLADLDDDSLPASVKPVVATTGENEQPIDLRNWPPLVVGPFGYTLAPALAGAIFNTASLRGDQEKPHIDKARASWHWFENLTRLPVFDTGGELGTVEDLTFDTATFTCNDLMTRDAKGDGAAYPVSAIRRVTKDADAVIVELSDPPPYSVERIRAAT